MSRRNGSDGTPVSLFSFQDIIMSVAGIMLLITLLLTLEVVQRVQEQTPQESPPDLSELEEQIQKVQQELETLRQPLPDVAMIDELLELTPEDVTRRNEEVRLQVEQLHTEIPQMERRLEEAKQKRTAIGIPDPTEQRLDIEAMNRRLAEIQAEREQIKEGGTLWFNPPENFRGRMWVVDCGVGQLKLWPTDGKDEMITLRSADDVELSGLFFEQIMVTQPLDPQGNLLVFFARPGTEDFSRSVPTLLREKGYRVGFELIGANQEIKMLDESNSEIGGGGGS